MKQYISKDALIAEIERRIELNTEWRDACETLAFLAANEAVEEDKKILYIINFLEVKEMDLEKEYKVFVEEDPVYNKLVNSIVGKTIAKHFFELGLKAQKEEQQ